MVGASGWWERVDGGSEWMVGVSDGRGVMGRGGRWESGLKKSEQIRSELIRTSTIQTRPQVRETGIKEEDDGLSSVL